MTKPKVNIKAAIDEYKGHGLLVTI